MVLFSIIFMISSIKKEVLSTSWTWHSIFIHCR